MVPGRMNDKKITEAKHYGHLLLKFRVRSVAEMQDRLKRQGFTKGVIETVIHDFTEAGLLDDAKFIKLLISTRMSLRPIGRIALQKELEDKGIKDSDIKKAMQQFDDEYDEKEVAAKLLKARAKTMGKIDESAKRRLFNFLERRGFSYDTIHQLTSEL